MKTKKNVSLAHRANINLILDKLPVFFVQMERILSPLEAQVSTSVVSPFKKVFIKSMHAKMHIKENS